MTNLLAPLCQGNASAFEFCRTITQIASTYDDLIDRDNPVSDAQIHAMVFEALVTLPRNTFYRQHFGVLNPLIINSLHNWRIANAMEQHRNAEDLNIAFIIRSSYADLLRMVAFLVGGEAHALEMGLLLRRAVHSEGLSNYLTEMSEVGHVS